MTFDAGKGSILIPPTSLSAVEYAKSESSARRSLLRDRAQFYVCLIFSQVLTCLLVPGGCGARASDRACQFSGIPVTSW